VKRQTRETSRKCIEGRRLTKREVGLQDGNKREDIKVWETRLRTGGGKSTSNTKGGGVRGEKRYGQKHEDEKWLDSREKSKGK